ECSQVLVPLSLREKDFVSAGLAPPETNPNGRKRKPTPRPSGYAQTNCAAGNEAGSKVAKLARWPGGCWQALVLRVCVGFGKLWRLGQRPGQLSPLAN